MILTEYFRQIALQVGDVDLGLVARRRVPLDSVYAEAPSTSRLTLEISSDGQPTRWVMTDPESASQDVFNAMLKTGDAERLDALIRLVRDAIRASLVLDLDAPRARPLVLSPLWQAGLKVDALTPSLSALIAAFKRVVVTGPPGSGKSTFARKLAVQLATHMDRSGALGEAPAPMDESRTPGGGLPVFVELRSFVDFANWPDTGIAGVTSESLVQYIEERYMPRRPDDEKRELQRALTGGGSFIILDGLDEVRLPNVPEAAAARRAQLIYFLDTVERALAPSKIVLTSRDYAYATWTIPNYERLRMGAFGDDHIYDLARKLLVYVDEIPEADLEAHLDQLLDRIYDLVPENLRQRPLFVSLLAGVYARGVAKGRAGLPAKLTELYEESVMLLLDRWTAKDPAGSLLDRLGCDIPQLRERVEAVAYMAQRSEADNPSGDKSPSLGFPDTVLLRQLVTLPGRTNYQEIVGYLNRETGLILSPAPGNYSFAHRSFQEYLAACYLLNFRPSSAEWVAIGGDVANRPLAWREIFRLLGTMLVERERVDDLWSLVDTLLGSATDAATHLTEARSWVLWLVATYLEDVVRASTTLGRSRQLVMTEFLGAIDGIRTSPLPVQERCQVWNTRSRLRARLEIETPSVDWCTIPEGEFRMGLDEIDAEPFLNTHGSGLWLPKREVPAHAVFLDAYRIARHAVTRVDFGLFLLADDGYYNNNNWRADYVQFRHPSLAGMIVDPYGNELPDAPRTEVTWFDAVAYTCWLSRRLGFQVSLPSEPQWEKAARGRDSRLFPWGSDYQVDRCNSLETGIGDIVAVGAFVNDNGYWGEESPCDLAGNVWEWCSTICEIEGDDSTYAYPYRDLDGRESGDPSLQLLRVVRGGSYVSPIHHLMTTFRGRDRPNMRMYRQGFRIVAIG